MARYFSAIVRMPVRLPSGALLVIEDASLDVEDDLSCWRFALSKPLAGPLFPGGTRRLEKDLKLAASMVPAPGPSIPDIRITLFADEMPKIEVRKDFAKALLDWT